MYGALKVKGKNHFISYLKEKYKKGYIKYELSVRVHHNETYPWSMVQIFYKKHDYINELQSIIRGLMFG